MPAFKGKNLRSGDLAEQLGTLLLQNLALVAPVPRTEDVGVDVVATLLEDFDNRRFKATNSFYVQIKSSSVDSIEYKNEEIEWLFALELPFFIARVNKCQLRIELYCCHALHEAFVVNQGRKTLRIEFGNGSKADEIMAPDAVVNVGPPVFSWSMDDVDKVTDLRSKFSAVCKAHIEVAKLSMELRRVGRVETLIWKEKEMPVVMGFRSIDPHTREKIQDISNIAIPYLVPFLDLCVRYEDDYWLDEILRLTQERRLLLYTSRTKPESPDTEVPMPEEFQFILKRRAEDAVIIERYLKEHEIKFGEKE
ncbi:MAG: hypothetical protein P0Y58_02155 [Candidatus Pseudomonas phytovorans]|uniref:DUF4365 domain-containing protein n=1 Tax=Candidatus Pseudomonas phytovorans TaxID=3121377 RepID=A0AAJ6BCA1_9PSED|nr:hypothetical protein [Pseudomonas sp.]WEK31012.1 MAG: hypothetical protein P0Y58_02155 [Pseudomonas sp.]